MRLQFLLVMVDSGARQESWMGVVSGPQLANGQEHSKFRRAGWKP